MTITSITSEEFYELSGRNAGSQGNSEETQALLALAIGEAVTISTEHHHRTPKEGASAYESQLCTLYGRMQMASRRAGIKIMCRCKDNIVYVLRTA